MEVNDLIVGINTGSLSELFPVKEVSSSNLEFLKNSGYQISMTCNEYLEKFPWLPVKYVYASKTMLSSLLYYDPDMYICIPLNIYADVYFGADGEKNGESILTLISKCKEYYELRRFKRLIMLCPVDSYKAELLSRIVHDFPSTETFTLFREVYTLLDYGFEKLNVSDIVELYDNAPPEHRERLRKQLRNNNRITIYRGESERSTHTHKAFSWSLNIRTAYFFAIRLATESACVVTAEVSIEDIIDYFDRRNEDEILIKPGTAKVIRRNRMYGIDKIKSLRIGEDFFDEAKILFKDIENKMHGYSHVCRMLLMLEISCDSLYLSKREYEILKHAILYHDISRESDIEEVGHGVKSAKLYMGYNRGNVDSEIISAIIANHDIEDEIGCANISSFGEYEVTTRLLSVLKDLDALDRLRFSLNDLNIKYIRNRQMLKFILVSKLLQKFRFEI